MKRFVSMSPLLRSFILTEMQPHVYALLCAEEEEFKFVLLTITINGLRSRIAPMMATSDTMVAQTPPTISSAAPEKALPVTNPKLF